MAKNRRRNVQSYGPARHPFQSLGHTAGPSFEPFDYADPVSLAEIREAFSGPVRSPLIRTVRIERDSFNPPPRQAKRQSPTVQIRATMRSSDKSVRSPFLNATMVTPQLADRAIVCAQRGIRREVLFATKRTGKGSRSPKKRFSKVRC